MRLITFGFDSEDIGLVDDAPFETGTESSHFARVAAASHVHFERRSGHRRSVEQNVDRVLSYNHKTIIPSHIYLEYYYAYQLK